MTDEITQLAASIPAGAWTGCEVRRGDGREKTRWAPLIPFAGGELALGLSQSAEWLWGERGRVPLVYPLETPAVVGLLPILEIPFWALIAKAHEAAQRLGIDPESLSDALPLVPIIEAALTLGTEYWVELGMDWLDASDTESSSLADSIAQLAGNRGLPQHLRHRLLRYARR